MVWGAVDILLLSYLQKYVQYQLVWDNAKEEGGGRRRECTRGCEGGGGGSALWDAPPCTIPWPSAAYVLL